MVNAWIALLACALAAFIGYCWGRDVTYQRVARNVVRLEALVPSPGLLRSLAYCADGVVPVYAEAARDLAARIEEAGEGE